MRKAIGILGALLIITFILISGSAVARWVYATIPISSSDCTNPQYILGPEDDAHATIGHNPSSLGKITVALAAGHGMDANAEFTVFAWGSSTVNDEEEYYDVYVSMDNSSYTYVGSDDDQENHTFTTPNYGSDWRFIHIEGTSGNIDDGDPNYGPEITAVGWDEP